MVLFTGPQEQSVPTRSASPALSTRSVRRDGRTCRLFLRSNSSFDSLFGDCAASESDGLVQNPQASWAAPPPATPGEVPTPSAEEARGPTTETEDEVGEVEHINQPLLAALMEQVQFALAGIEGPEIEKKVEEEDNEREDPHYPTRGPRRARMQVSVEVEDLDSLKQRERAVRAAAEGRDVSLFLFIILRPLLYLLSQRRCEVCQEKGEVICDQPQGGFSCIGCRRRKARCTRRGPEQLRGRASGWRLLPNWSRYAFAPLGSPCYRDGISESDRHIHKLVLNEKEAQDVWVRGQEHEGREEEHRKEEHRLARAQRVRDRTSRVSQSRGEGGSRFTGAMVETEETPQRGELEQEGDAAETGAGEKRPRKRARKE